MYLTKDEFLQKFGILPQEFEEADISWEELLEIADVMNGAGRRWKRSEKNLWQNSAGQGKKDRTAVVPQPPEGHRTPGGKAGAQASGKLCKIPENGCDKLYALCDRPDRNPGTFAVSGGLGKLP